MENEENRDYILKELPFEAASLDAYLPDELKSETTKQGYLQLIPSVHKTDGFFISKYVKNI